MWQLRVFSTAAGVPLTQIRVTCNTSTSPQGRALLNTASHTSQQLHTQQMITAVGVVKAGVCSFVSFSFMDIPPLLLWLQDYLLYIIVLQAAAAADSATPPKKEETHCTAAAVATRFQSALIVKRNTNNTNQLWQMPPSDSVLLVTKPEQHSHITYTSLCVYFTSLVSEQADEIISGYKHEIKPCMINYVRLVKIRLW